MTDTTIAFLDLTRFTALADVHGDDLALDVIDRFVGAVEGAVHGRGRVVKTMGDGVLLQLHGPRASRLAGLAGAGELLATDPAARSAAAAGWQVEPLGLTVIRGLHDPVCIHRVVLCPAQDCDTDPVCGMRITPGPATPSEVVNGRRLSFCSPACLERLRSAPERYLGEEVITRG